VVLAGPSGTGKGTVVRKLLEREPRLWFSVSANTRARRPDEREGVDYLFMTREEFENVRDHGGFLESFEVYGDLQGTPKAPIVQHLGEGDDVLLEVDVQGALRVKEVVPEAVLVFLRPPSRAEQRRRLLERERRDGTEPDPADVERRLAAAEAEEALVERFDAVVVNDDVDAAVAELAGILASRRATG
jgi:guanylate kinase